MQSIEVLYSAREVEEEGLVNAKGTVWRSMPKVGQKVRMAPYNIKEGKVRVELGDGDIVLELLGRLWRDDWMYEL